MVRQTLRSTVVRTIGEDRARRLVRTPVSLLATAHARFTVNGRRNARALRVLRDTRVGQTCVIIGNGPSLNITNLNQLAGVPTFGLNRIFLMYERLGFVPTYHAVVNRLVVEQSAAELCALTMPTFTTWPNRSELGNGDSVYYLNRLTGPLFSTDIERGVWEGATVTFVAMQVAYYLGFSRVLLVGVDHDFADKGAAHRTVESEGPDRNHFDPNYFGKGFRWQLPDLETSEVAYALARDAFAARNGEIVDCTVGGKLQVFRKSTLEESL
jgi:hypothetical protein